MIEPLGPSDPTRIGPFRLVGRIGAGGMGRVYLGERSDGPPEGRCAAVKLIYESYAADPSFGTRFAREVAMARRAHGSGVAAVLDADPHAERPWLATEYVPGPSLSAAVGAVGPLPEAELMVLAARSARALARLHELDVVHRDVKPSNLLISADGPRLIDLGVARAAEDTRITSTGLVSGTPAFMSPEQALGEETGSASDVFSLAAVVVFAALGRGPFGSGGSPATMMYRTVHAEPDLDGVPDPLRAELTGCLVKDPAARPTAAELATRLAEHLPPASAWPPPTWAPLLSAPVAHPAAGRARTPIDGPRTGPVPVAAEPLPWDEVARPRSRRWSGPRRGLGRWRGSRRGVGLIAAGLAVLLLATGIAHYVRTRDAGVAALLGTDRPGQDPFGPSLVVNASITPTASAEAALPREPVGDLDGLYFDVTGTASCDRGALAGLLGKDPKLAGAWSGAVGRTAADVAGYLATLTPVRLRADTGVTAFSYTGGEARPYPAILQAGTAVLVDDHGVPRVHCADADPLAADPVPAAGYDGPAWAGFTPTGSVRIQPAAAPVREFGLVDLAGTAPFRRPPGSDGTHDVAQLPTTGRLDGHYALAGPMSHCDHYWSCRGDGPSTFTMDPTFTECPARCAMVNGNVLAPGGDPRDNFPRVTLNPGGGAGQFSANGDANSRCTRRTAGGAETAQGPLKGRWQLTVAVIDSALVDGVWRATRVKIDEDISYVASGICPASTRGFSLSGAAR